MLAINSRVTPFSYQSLMPAVAGTPRYENGGLVAGSVWASLVPPLRLPWIPAFAGITMLS